MRGVAANNSHSLSRTSFASDIKDRRLFSSIFGVGPEIGEGRRREISTTSLLLGVTNVYSFLAPFLRPRWFVPSVIERAILTLERVGMAPRSLCKRGAARRVFHEPRRANHSYFVASARIPALSEAPLSRLSSLPSRRSQIYIAATNLLTPLLDHPYFFPTSVLFISLFLPILTYLFSLFE